MSLASLVQLFLGAVLILSALGVILFRKPVHACLSFLMTLLALASLFFELSAQFIAVMQIFVYAGAILVLFMFVIVLFQDAHQQISRFAPKSAPLLILMAASIFVLALGYLGSLLTGITSKGTPLNPSYGTVEGLGNALYIDFFFPFEAVTLLFLVALVGALYIGKKEN